MGFLRNTHDLPLARGATALLTPEEEVELARRIEVAERHALALLLDDGGAVAELSEVVRDVRRGAVTLRQVTRVNAANEDAGSSALPERLASAAHTAARLVHAKGASSAERDALVSELTELRPTRWVFGRLRGHMTGSAADATAASALQLEQARAEVGRAIERVEASRSRLVTSNLGLVVYLAKREKHRGLDLADLVQAGCIGLMRAIDKFEYRRGYRLTTYASWWVREAINTAIMEQARTVRVPAHIVQRNREIRRAMRTMLGERGEMPSATELGERVGLRTEHVQEILGTATVTTSLDGPAARDDRGSPIDRIGDEGASPFDVAVEGEVQDCVRRALARLDRREAIVLRMRFGIDTARAHTLEEIGRHFHFTKERARQIEASALRKLREQATEDGLPELLG